MLLLPCVVLEPLACVSGRNRGRGPLTKGAKRARFFSTRTPVRKNIVMGKLMQFLSTAAWPVVAGLGLSDQKRAQPITPQGLFRLGYLLFGDWSTQNAPAASGMLPTTYFHVLPCTSRGRGWPFKKHCGAGWLINKMLFKNIRSAIVFCHDAAG
jgi:hypothetical protein